MSAGFLHCLAREQICNVKQPKLILKIYFWIRTEPEYSQEELTPIEEEAAAAAAEQASPVAEDEEPERAGLLWSPIDTNTESLCCSEFQ